MKTSSLLPCLLVLLTACGKPPKSGGPPAGGDFPVNVVGGAALSTNLLETVALVGTFEAPESIVVQGKIAGDLLELPIAQGAVVAKGDVLARLDPVKIEARLAEAKARLSLAQANFTRSRALRESETISEQEYDEAAARLEEIKASIALLESESSDAVLLAPFDGRVGERHVSVGQNLQVGQPLMDLVQLDPLDIRFDVPERYLSAVRTGLVVRIRTDAYPDEAFEGVVNFLAPAANRVTRTLTVKARVPNGADLLRPGMYGRVMLILAEKTDTLVVPEAAVMQRGEQNFVMAQNGEGRAEMRPVKVGLRLAGRMEILEGLQAGDAVVVEGLIKVPPGALLAFSEESRRYGLAPTPPPAAGPEATPES